MIFYKTVTSGNDFIHIDLQELDTETGSQDHSQLARNLCARRTGIGADGLVFYRICQETVDFRIFNHDGGEAEISGNGMAGLAALLFHQKAFRDTLTLNTRVGRKVIERLHQIDQTYQLKVEIGLPDFSNHEQFPFLIAGQSAYQQDRFVFYPVSVGNPHAVVLLDNPMAEDEMAAMAANLANHSTFPAKANVELVYNLRHHECQVYFHERGVGKTLSSSTGSAAVFAVLQDLGKIGEKLTIQTDLENIRISGTTTIYVENSTKIMYKGVCLS